MNKVLVGMFFSFLTIYVSRSNAQEVEHIPAPGEISTTHSRIFVFVKGKGAGHSHAIEAKYLSGFLNLGAGQQAGELNIDMLSFDADTHRSREMFSMKGSASTWMRNQVNKEMHSTKVLDTKKFPRANLVIDSILPDKSAIESTSFIYTLSGTFKFHGEEKMVSFPIKAKDERGWVKITGEFVFKQSDYGIRPFSRAFGTVGLEDSVQVKSEIFLSPNQASADFFQNRK